MGAIQCDRRRNTGRYRASTWPWAPCAHPHQPSKSVPWCTTRWPPSTARNCMHVGCVECEKERKKTKMNENTGEFWQHRCKEHKSEQVCRPILRWMLKLQQRGRTRRGRLTGQTLAPYTTNRRLCNRQRHREEDGGALCERAKLAPADWAPHNPKLFGIPMIDSAVWWGTWECASHVYVFHAQIW